MAPFTATCATCEKGAILQVAVGNDVARYDGCTDYHHRFVCNNCNQMFDVYAESADNCEKLGI